MRIRHRCRTGRCNRGSGIPRSRNRYWPAGPMALAWHTTGQPSTRQPLPTAARTSRDASWKNPFRQTGCEKIETKRRAAPWFHFNQMQKSASNFGPAREGRSSARSKYSAEENAERLAAGKTAQPANCRLTADKSNSSRTMGASGGVCWQQQQVRSNSAAPLAGCFLAQQACFGRAASPAMECEQQARSGPARLAQQHGLATAAIGLTATASNVIRATMDRSAFITFASYEVWRGQATLIRRY